MNDEPDTQRLDTQALAQHLRGQQARRDAQLERPPIDLGISDEDRAAARFAARMVPWCEIVPVRFRDATLGDFIDPARSLLEQWTDSASSDGVNLVISGPVGVGKSHAAFAAVRPLFFDGRSIVFATMERFLSALDWRSPEKRRNYELFTTVDVLYLDDLGVARETSFAQEAIHDVLNQRWMDDLPSIATTNLEKAELSEAIGPRSYSRLTGAVVGVKLKGEDRRRKGRG